MSRETLSRRIELDHGSKVVVIGGGPAGSFFALHLLREAKELGRELSVIVLERRRSPPAGPAAENAAPPCAGATWKGCNYCAGGISPRLCDVLDQLRLPLPERLIQRQIHSVTIQGYWKNIELHVPPGRRLFSVFRGSRPCSAGQPEPSFDAFLLDQAVAAGAQLVPGEVFDVSRGEDGRPVIQYESQGQRQSVRADFLVFAAGINERVGMPPSHSRIMTGLKRLVPDFIPPRVRQALVFELTGSPRLPASLASTIHFVEYGSRELKLEMCSLVPKRDYVTVILLGRSVDSAGKDEVHALIRQFLELPHIRKLAPFGLRPVTSCFCRPNMVVRSAKNAFGDRVAAVGDMVTARLYKDGILSAQQTAQSLAECALDDGIDRESLRAGYQPTLRRFERNNRAAYLVFLLHRIIFGSSVLSRILYQAVITERKSTPAGRRCLESILWRIASGDEEYVEICRTLLRPAAVWSVFRGGALVTLRNYLAELCFGLNWQGIGRFTTGVALERLWEKRRQFARLLAQARVPGLSKPAFERMYTVKISASRDRVFDQLGRFGEPDRQYLWPRWVRIRRVSGLPNTPGCVIQYEVVSRAAVFHLQLIEVLGGHLAIYRVQDGFARDGILLFEIEESAAGACALSIYVAFNFPGGSGWAGRLFWKSFRCLFPAFVHDVIWNHSLCQLKDAVEGEPGRNSETKSAETMTMSNDRFNQALPSTPAPGLSARLGPEVQTPASGIPGC